MKLKKAGTAGDVVVVRAQKSKKYMRFLLELIGNYECFASLLFMQLN